MPTDARAIAQALIALFMNKQLRHEMGAAATKHTATNFSSNRLVQDHVGLYRRLIADNSRPYRQMRALPIGKWKVEVGP